MEPNTRLRSRVAINVPLNRNLRPTLKWGCKEYPLAA